MFYTCRTSDFSDLLQPFHSKTRFPQAQWHNFNSFVACFFDFVSSFVFDNNLRFMMPVAGQFGIMFQKNDSEKSFKKRGPRPEAPREAASRAHFSNKKQQLELKMLLEFVTIASLPKNCLEMLLELASIPKKFPKERKRINVKKSTLPVI